MLHYFSQVCIKYEHGYRILNSKYLTNNAQSCLHGAHVCLVVLSAVAVINSSSKYVLSRCSTLDFFICQVCLRPSPSLPVHHAAPGPAAPLRHLPHRLLHQAPRHHCHGQVRERVSSHQVREGSDKEASNCKGHRQHADEAPLPKESVPLLEQFQFIFHLIARKEC